MSDGDPANRLRGLMLATPEATPYQVYLADAYEALADSRKEIEYEIERRVAGEERASDLDIYYQAIAEVSARLAQAEQQRIANLIALANSRPSLVRDDNLLSYAMNEAIRSLGIEAEYRKNRGDNHDA